MGTKWSNAEYLTLQGFLLQTPRPPSSWIAVEMGRPQGTIDAKISELGLTQRALRPVPKDYYAKPGAERIARQRNCMDCRRSFFLGRPAQQDVHPVSHRSNGGGDRCLRLSNAAC
jgi:hypothetical protein